ncbi:hypothetical protein NL676_000092 [Syzygium grande]|nr:hypothetical protein NL676_000092 [Syzygium grande]
MAKVVNHGICQSVLEEAISAASSFFNQPMEQKVKLMSGDVHKPVRYGTGFNFREGVERTQYWRLFLKHYAHPLQDWIGSWPENPPAYREKMGKYCARVRRVAMELTEAITESLGIGSAYLTPGMSHGMQVMAVNCYPPCPNPDLALGLPTHSDYGCLTVLLQSLPGLQIMDVEDGSSWKLLPRIDGALPFGPLAILNTERTRISITSLHSLGMDDKMGTAKELVSEHHPMDYHESSFRDFLNFLPASDFDEGKSFIRTLRTEK